MLRRVLPTALLAGRAASGLTHAPIRAVISDVDGTLFPFGQQREISPANRAALERCVAEGVHICLATGRIPGPWFERVREQLPALGPCVFGNGALILGAQGEVLFESCLQSEITKAVLEYTRGGRAGSGGGQLCVLAATRWEDGQVRYCELAPSASPTWVTELIRGAGEPEAVLLPTLDDFDKRHVLKFVIWTSRTPGEPGWALMDNTVAELRAALEGTGATILHHGSKWCEVLPGGTNKGEGVLKMLRQLGGGVGGGVLPEEVLACGDAENDVEMLRLAGVGAAMGNSQPAAIDAADVVVASNEDDGVAEAVRRFVFGEE